MKNLTQQLIELFSDAAASAYPQLCERGKHPELEIKQATHEQFGHYQCNSAMRLAKDLREPPRKIAENLIAEIEKNDGSLIEKMEAAGPGFINITLNPDQIAAFADRMLRNKQFGLETARQKKVIVEFSSPNTAKELHVGHLRSTIIGDSIARIFEYFGHDVLRLNHVGDWGTQFGMLIAYMKEEAPEVLKGNRDTDLSHLVDWYKAAKKKFDEDPDFRKRSQLEVVALQGGDPESFHAWEIICGISRKAYREIYDLLDVKIEERGESFYNPVLADTVKELEKLGLVEISEGAKCIFLEGYKNREGKPLPMLIQKSDGGYNYDTTDMAAIRQRLLEEKADRIIYVTDAGQSLHFQMIFDAARKAGWLDDGKVQMDHVTFGLVLGPDGKKFRTRSGETEKLIDLLFKAVEKAKEIVREKNPDMDEKQLEELARKIGIGAVKYADLSTNRVSDYTFSYDRMLRFDGNTAAYLMYCYVRVNGIKRKTGSDIEKVIEESSLNLSHASEIALALHLARFGEVLERVMDDLLPNRLTDYLYSLAEKFNAFFRDCRVEGSDEENSRLLLCEITSRVMRTGLHLLGVETVERM